MDSDYDPLPVSQTLSFKDINNEQCEDQIDAQRMILNSKIKASKVLSKDIFSYDIPKVSEGSCSLHPEIEPVRFSLKPYFQGAPHKPLTEINAVVDWLKEITEADWAGVYVLYSGDKLHEDQEKPPYLLKIAYQGKPSRPIFPIDKKYSQKSNNVACFLKTEIIWVRDIKRHVENGGPYYECDPLVQSELCFPIVLDNKAIGIIDLEGLRKDQFTQRDIALANMAANVLGPMICNLPWKTKAQDSYNENSREIIGQQPLQSVRGL